MPTHKSAAKRIRTSKKANQRNRILRSGVKTAIKKVTNSKNKKSAEESLKNAIIVIDKAKKKGIFHANNAARKKSRLAKFASKLK